MCFLVVSSYIIEEKEDAPATETDKAGAPATDSKAPANPNPSPDAPAKAAEEKKESDKTEAQSTKADKPEEKTKSGTAKSDIAETTTDESPDENTDESNEEEKEEPESNAEEAKENNESENNEEPQAEGESSQADAKESENDDEEGAEQAPLKNEEDSEEPSCNLKFKKVGCYKKRSKKQTFNTFIKGDDTIATKKGKIINSEVFNEKLPQIACECANAAINAGNAVFSLRNIAECWTGPDDTKYDAEGPSNECVTFDKKPCNGEAEVCSGKRHADFVYFIDSPEHTKSAEEVAIELAKEKKEAEKKKKKAQQKKNKHKKKGKGKKGKHSQQRTSID